MASAMGQGGDFAPACGGNQQQREKDNSDRLRRSLFFIATKWPPPLPLHSWFSVSILPKKLEQDNNV